MSDHDKGKDLIDAFRGLIEGAAKEPVFKDGFYEGTIVTYPSGFQVFYPYVPLMMTGVSYDSTTEEAIPGQVSFKSRYGIISTSERPTEAEWRAMEEARNARKQ